MTTVTGEIRSVGGKRRMQATVFSSFFYLCPVYSIVCRLAAEAVKGSLAQRGALRHDHDTNRRMLPWLPVGLKGTLECIWG